MENQVYGRKERPTKPSYLTSPDKPNGKNDEKNVRGISLYSLNV